ncbi:MAG: macro domain-containing protein [Sulfuriflexus sp.]|nr:macro domain-containing protein [Sulfuriflexus sp.]
MAPVDVIVNAANGGLSHGGGVAGQFIERGGEIIQQESDQFIKEHGELETGMVALTSAGSLPYQAVLHAVGPRMGEGDEQEKVRLSVSRSLKLCNMHDWDSVAFPAISMGIFGVPVDVVAKGFFHAISSFWDARLDESPSKIIICLTKDSFQSFRDAFNEAAKIPGEAEQKLQPISKDESEVATGIVSLDEDDISALEDDDDVNGWFK